MDCITAKLLFQEYHSKIKQLKETDVDELNRLLDQINAVNYDSCPDNELIEDLLRCIAKLIPSGNDHILSKFSNLIYYLLNKQKIVLSVACSHYLIEFVISSVQSCGKWVLSDVLIALSSLLHGNTEVEKFHSSLIGNSGALTDLLVPCEQDESVQYNAFQCLLNLLGKNPSELFMKDELLNLYCQKCICVMKMHIASNRCDILSLKVLISSLKCLQLIFLSKNVNIKNFGELLGTLKCVLFCGLPGPVCSPGNSLLPTLTCPDSRCAEETMSESDNSSHPKLRKQKRNKKTRAKRGFSKKDKVTPNCKEESENKVSDLNDDFGNISVSSPSSQKGLREIKTRSSSSDSEFSDAESHTSKIKKLQATARQNAFLALQAVVKTSDKKLVFGYWSSFLPDFPAMPGLAFSQNIFTVILKDPSSQVRLSALSLLAEMLTGSKQFLSYADGRSAGHLSFTSLSSVLASMISEIHRSLLLALLSENSSYLLTQILKCYAVLAENVPYAKLNKEILLKLLKHIKGFLFHKDTQVQVACLAVFGSIVNSDQTPEEIRELMLSSDFDSAINILYPMSSYSSTSNVDSANQTSVKLPWIIDVCIKNVFSEEPLPIRIQSVQVLTIIVGKYFLKINLLFTFLENVILFCLNDPDTSMQLHGAKLLDVFGRCTNNAVDLEGKEDVQLSISKLWQNVLSGCLIRSLTDDTHKNLQSVCCDCLSTLPPTIFEKLLRKDQISYITVLLGLASDSNPNVRGAALRCLGVYSLFPCLTEDFAFLNDVSVCLIKSVNDPNANVRFKASWSLGNLSDSLFLNRDPSVFGREISSQFFYSVAMACVQFSKDSDRVKANAVRALGNFLHYMPNQFFNLPITQDFIGDACEVLTSAASSNAMKVCWNACYAMGNMLRNTSLLNCEWMNLEPVIMSLLNALKSPNFKVRISAAQALTTMTSRDLYGKLFAAVWQHMLAALLSVSEDVNFKEIKHQETLRDQLCCSVCQLAAVIIFKDVSLIAKDTLESREILLTSMWKFGSRTTDLKITNVYIAMEHLTSLKNENSNSEDAQLLIFLQDSLNQAVIGFYGKELE